MIDLLQTVATVASGLTTGALFTTDSGVESEIEYHIHVLSPRPKTTTAQVMPFCLAKVRDFTLFPGRHQAVELLYCLYNADRAAAMDDMARLSVLLEPLAVRGIQYPGWKLTGIAGTPGDRETGVQPHPEYYLALTLAFTGPGIKQIR